MACDTARFRTIKTKMYDGVAKILMRVKPVLNLKKNLISLDTLES